MRHKKQLYHARLVRGLALTAIFCSTQQAIADDTPTATVVNGGDTLTVSAGETQDYWQLIVHDQLVVDSGNAVKPANLTLNGGTVNAGVQGDGQGTGMIIGNTTWSLGIVTINADSVLNVDGNMLVGLRGSGTVNQNGGDVKAGTLVLAEQTTYGGQSASTYTLSGGTLTTTDYTYVGGWPSTNGAATFTQTGGNHNADHIVVGRGSLGTNQYRLDGGAVVANALTIGTHETGSSIGGGTFQQTGGTLQINGEAILGATTGVFGTYTQTGGIAEFTTLTVGESGIGTYTLEDGSLFVADDEYIGKNTGSMGTFNQSGGTHNVGNNLYVDMVAASKGTYNLSDGSLTVGFGGGDNTIVGTIVGSYGSGSFNHSGGSHQTNALVLGQDGGSDGTYTLSESEGAQSTLFALQGIDVGHTGTGTFTQEAGEVKVDGNLVISRNAESNGTYTLNSGTLNTGETHVSAGSTNGLFIQNGGSHQTAEVGGTLALGYEAESSGSYTLYGGELRSEWERIGMEGMGTFTQSGGTNSATTLVLGQESGSQGDYTLNDGELTTTDAVIGSAGWGQFYQSGGTFTVSQTLTLGETTASGGARLQLSGNAALTAQDVTIGGQEAYITQYGGTFTVKDTLSLVSDGPYGGSYTLYDGELKANNAIISDTKPSLNFFFHQYGGTFTVDETLTLGQGKESSAAYSLNKGTLNANNEIIGEQGDATFGQGANTANHISDTLILGMENSARGQYIHSGGTLEAMNAVIGAAGFGYFTTSGGSVTIGDQTNEATEALVVGLQGTGLYTQDAGSTDVYGDVIVGQESGSKGQFAQTGGDTSISGALTLGQGNASSGTYSMTGGSLTASSIAVGENGTGTLTQTGGTTSATTMTIANGSTASLSGGHMTISDSLTNNGSLTLSAAGLLTVGNTFTNGDGANLTVDLSGYTEGSFITLLSSTVDLDGTLQITGTSSLNTEMTFTLISAAHGFSQASDLTFTYLDLPEISGFHWEYGLAQLGTAYLLSLKSGQSPVPVPSSILLLGSGLVLLARRRRHPTLQ